MEGTLCAEWTMLCRLTRCIGAADDVGPYFQSGYITEEETFLLCSDGFYHEPEEDELVSDFGTGVGSDETILKERLRECAELAMARGETDNLTCVLLRKQ